MVFEENGQKRGIALLYRTGAIEIRYAVYVYFGNKVTYLFLPKNNRYGPCIYLISVTLICGDNKNLTTNQLHRSFPELEIVKECSLMSVLRWNFKKNMEKTLTSTTTGQLALVSHFSATK